MLHDAQRVAPRTCRHPANAARPHPQDQQKQQHDDGDAARRAAHGAAGARESFTDDTAGAQIKLIWG